MLVIVMENQLLSPAAVCNNCPMASQSGLPRWKKGRLRCGRPVERANKKEADAANAQADCPAADKAMGSPSELPSQKACTQYECAMGFRIAELSEQSV
ncbi:MAG: hypothetical protein WA947_15820 [Phormidesmis sp.]